MNSCERVTRAQIFIDAFSRCSSLNDRRARSADTRSFDFEVPVGLNGGSEGIPSEVVVGVIVLNHLVSSIDAARSAAQQIPDAVDALDARDLPDAAGKAWHTAHQALARYAAAVTGRLGDRVRYWVTHNEPWCVATLGYEEACHLWPLQCENREDCPVCPVEPPH